MPASRTPESWSTPSASSSRPGNCPPNFADLRSERLGHADGREQETLQVGRLEEGGGDPAAALFVVVDEEAVFVSGLSAQGE
jgi:hypothetical protein